MNEPIDVDAFVAQLADDDAIDAALLEIDDPVVLFLDELGDDEHTATMLAEFAEPPRIEAQRAEIAALEVAFWVADARVTGDWSTFQANVEASIRHALDGLAAPETE